jgi:TRAP-type mannitol/chloroaromatic compound transport system permease small subunit
VKRVLFMVDRISMWSGHLVAWAIVALTAVMVYSVVMRYVFRNPPLWAYDASYMLYGILFMVAGAYALARNSHVRGDMWYRQWTPRTQAIIDLSLYLLFFYPGVVALLIFGWEFAEASRARNEYSNQSPGGPLIWPYKFVIPISAFLLLIQGVAETIRCVQAIRTRAWPERLSDVEETETRLAKEEQF